MASYMEKILSREPGNPYLQADGSLAELRKRGMDGYRPLASTLPNLDPMLGYASTESDSRKASAQMAKYRPNTADPQGVRGAQPQRNDMPSFWDVYGSRIPAIDGFDAAQEAVVGKPDVSDRAAEIDRRLAEIDRELASLDEEEEMGKYKFLYDSDPSTYVNVKQSKRNAEATENIRKSNEEASKQSNLKSLWEGTTMKSEELYWQLKGFEQKYSEAQRENNVYGMEEALDNIKKTQALLNRTNAERDELRNRLMAGMNMDGKNDSAPVDGRDYSEYEKGIAGAKDVSEMRGALDKLKKTIKVDNISIPPRQKALNAKQWMSDIAAQRKAVNDSPLSDDNKQKLLGELDDMEESVRNYLKPAGKGGQGESMTAEKFRSLSARDLVKLGYKALAKYENMGFTNANLEWAKANAAGK